MKVTSFFTHTKPYDVLFGDVDGDRGVECSFPVSKNVLLVFVHCEVKLLTILQKRNTNIKIIFL